MSEAKDPMVKASFDHQRELFARFSKVANGFGSDAAIGAAMNVLINAIRQACPTWRQAEIVFDDTLGRSKQVLKDHYDAAGRKKGIFPYDQSISVGHLLDGDDFKKH